MAKVEGPVFILPKKRNGKKQGSVTGHVDHIITVQGAVDELPVKYGLSPVTEHESNGTIHSSVEELKNNMKIDLPIISDDEDMNDANTADSVMIYLQKKDLNYQALATNNSREIIDLSPIYENSSDACSSHGDLQETEIEVYKSYKLNSDNTDSLSATPNSQSQTQSEYSFEMGNLSDSLKSTAKRKKKVNIVTENQESGNTDTEKLVSEEAITIDSTITNNSKDYLTMTGTIKRGKNKGQSVDVQLNISRDELVNIEAAIKAEHYNKLDIFKCSTFYGPHIVLFSLACFPFVALISAAYSFYMGTKAWFNVFTHVIEDMPCVKKLILAPLLVLLYPLLIPLSTLGLGVYAGIVQLTISGYNWWNYVCDFEKGFYGWLCNAVGMSDCSPYEVVILMEVKS